MGFSRRRRCFLVKFFSRLPFAVEASTSLGSDIGVEAPVAIYARLKIENFTTSLGRMLRSLCRVEKGGL